MTETWLKCDNLPHASLSLNNVYSVYRCDREDDTPGGGVAMLVRSTFSHSFSFSRSFTLYIQLVGIQFHSPNILIITCYRSPSASLQALCAMLTFLADVYMNAIYPVILVGDFNFPGINWFTSSIFPMRTSPSSREFLNFCVSHNLHQHVSSATHCDNIIDLVLSSDQSVVSNVSVLQPFSTSDHSSVRFDLSLNLPCISAPSSYLNYSKGDYNQICAYLLSVNWPAVFDSYSTVDQCYQHFTEYCNKLISEFVPKMSDKQAAPQLPRSITISQEKVKRLFNIRHRCIARYCKASRYLKRQLDRLRLIEEERIAFSKNSKRFYKYCNSRLNSNTGIGTIKDPNGEVIACDEEKSNEFARFFQSVYKPPSTHIQAFSPRTNATLNYIDINHETTYRTLLKLPLRVSTSPDCIPYYFLQKCAVPLTSPLTYLFRRIMLTGEVPELWKTAIVRPIFKKGTRSNPSNYRPISLTSGISKVLERIICKQLLSYLLTNHLISSTQHGFLSRKSTTSALLSTLPAWQKEIDCGNFVSSCFIDLSRAFDSISHSLLLTKLQGYGISGCLLTLLKNLILNRTQSVTVNGKLSYSISCSSGVAQGTVLGPIMFILYINDISECLPPGVHCTMYADDSKIYSVNCPKTLQDGINAISAWSKMWQMDINVGKTKVMCIGNRHPNHTFYLEGAQLEEVTNFKDLGIIYDNRLTFSKHISSMASRCRAKSNFILKSFSTKNPALLFKLFVTYVRPIIEYCCEVWDPKLITSIKEIESVQRTFTKRVFNRVGLTEMTYEERLAALETTTLEQRRCAAGLAFMYKMVIGEVSLPFELYFTRSSRNSQSRNHSCFVLLPRVNHESFKQSFTFRYLSIWNQLPAKTFLSVNSSSFRRKVAKHLSNHNFSS